MANRNIPGRVKNKSDLSSNWALATTFIPLAGEIIYYSDLGKIKIGDGVTLLSNLSFVKGKPESKVESTLLASGWTAESTGGWYSFESTYPSSSYDIEIELNSSATEAQYKAFGKAGITGSSSTNRIKAIKTTPTIDIPIIITVKEK